MGYSRNVARILTLTTMTIILHLSHANEQPEDNVNNNVNDAHSSTIRRVLGARPLKQDDKSGKSYLDAHNAARKEVGVPPLTWDAGIAKASENYVNQRKLDCALVGSDNYILGENIAAGSGEFSVLDAIKNWVGEKASYDHKTNMCKDGKNCKHYTQVVWKKSTRLGCARAKCVNKDEYFVTCNYDPPGNTMGEKPY